MLSPPCTSASGAVRQACSRLPLLREEAEILRDFVTLVTASGQSHRWLYRSRA